MGERVIWIVLGTILIGCTEPSPYRIATRWLPSTLDPWADSRGGTHVYYSSLYYPLLRRQNQSFESEFLDLKRTQALTAIFDTYQLCLKKNLTFSDGSAIRIEDLELALVRTHRRKWQMPELKSVRRNEDCLTIALTKASPTYLDKLASRRSTILKSATVGSRTPVGLGPYKIVEFNSSRLVLRANGNRVVGDLKQLEWHVFELSDASELFLRSIDDWNFYVWPSIPSHLTKNFTQVERTLPITSVVKVFHPDKNRRKEFYDCFDRAGYIAAAELSVKRRDSLFPVGLLPQEELPYIEQRECYFPGSKPTISYYHASGDVKPIQSFFARAKQSLPFEVKVVPTSAADEYAGESQHRIGIYLGSIDSEEPLPEQFLGKLSPPIWHRKDEISGLTRILAHATEELEPQRRRMLIARAQKKALSSGFVIPLGQLQMTYFFRADLGNIQVLNAGNGVPLFEHITRKLTWDSIFGRFF